MLAMGRVAVGQSPNLPRFAGAASKVVHRKMLRGALLLALYAFSEACGMPDSALYCAGSERGNLV